MNYIDDIICRLCLKSTNNDYEIITMDTKDMLNFIQLQIDFSVTEEPVMCKHCEKTLQQVFACKLQQSRTEDNLVSFASNFPNNSFDLKQFYSNENERRDIVGNTNCDICRFCAQCIEKNYCISLEMVKKNMALEKDLVLKCITERVEAAMFSKKPVVCTTCIASLEKYLKFMKGCLDVEEKIKEYCKVEGTNSKDQIQLNDVLSFTTKNMLNDDTKLNKPYLVKLEDLYENQTNIGEVTNLTNADPVQFVKDEVPACIKGIKMEIKMEYNEISMNLKEELDIKDEHMPLNEKQDDLSSIEDPQEASNVAYICSSCRYETKDKESLALHKESCKNILTYKCETCAFTGKTKYLLNKHMLTHKDPSTVKKFTCDVCEYMTYRKDHLRAHVQTHVDPSLRVMFNCEVCSYRGTEKRKLAIHMLKHKDPSELTRYKCDACTYEANDRTNLRRHILMVHKKPSETRKYKCDACPYRAKTASRLKHHEFKHKDLSEVSVYECAVCSFKTKHKANLKAHIVIHQEPSGLKMYKCEFCPYEAKQRYRLANHMVIHKDPAEVKLYKCDHCTFQTKKKCYLNCHALIHKDRSEVILYKCDKCPYESKWKRCLIKHQETHKAPSERKLYKCDVCDFKTRENCKLTHHNMVAHNDLSQVNSMVFKCDYCPYKAKRRWYLTNHMLTCKDHLATTAYECEECNVVLKNKLSFTRHMIRHKDPSEVTIHKCEMCSYETRVKYYLTRHMKTHRARGEGNSD